MFFFLSSSSIDEEKQQLPSKTTELKRTLEAILFINIGINDYKSQVLHCQSNRSLLNADEKLIAMLDKIAMK